MDLKQQDDIEFGWNGVDGYIRNNGKYQLLYSKPAMSFDYGSCIYSNDDQVDDLTVDSNGAFIDLTEPQKQEIETYVKTYAVNDPWTPSLNKNYVSALDVVKKDKDVIIRVEKTDGTQYDTAPLVPNTIPATIAMDGDLLKITTIGGDEYKVKVQADHSDKVTDVTITADDRIKITFADGASKTYTLPNGGGSGTQASITVESGADVYVDIDTMNFTNMKITQSDPTSKTVQLTPQLAFLRTGSSGYTFANNVTFLPPMQCLSDTADTVTIGVDPKAFAERDNHGYLGAMASDLKLMGTSDEKVPRKEVIWFDQTVVSSEFIQIDRSGKAIGIQEDDELDPNVTGGTYFFIGTMLDSDTVPINDVDITIQLVDKTTKAVINDFKGTPCSITSSIKQKQKMGVGFGAWLVKAKALQEFQVEVIHNSLTGINLLKRGNGVSCLCVQSMTTANATGRAMTQFQLETRHLFYLSTKYYSALASLGLSAVGSYINQSMTGGEFQITSDGWWLSTEGNVGVIIGTDNHVDIIANTLGVWDMHKVLNTVDTQAVVGKAATINARITDKDDAFSLELLSYNGATDWDNTQAIITGENNGSPIYATGWSLVDSLFFSEDITVGDHDLSKDVTLPASSVKNLALVFRPVSYQLPCTVKVKDARLELKIPQTEVSMDIKKFTDVPDFDITQP